MKIKNKILRKVLGSFLAWLLDIGLEHLDLFNSKDPDNGKTTENK